MAELSELSIEEEWLTVHEACELIGVSPATLRRWSSAGRVNAFVTPGGHRRFARSTILSLLPTGESNRMCESVSAYLEFRSLYINELNHVTRSLALSPAEVAKSRDLATQVIDNLIIELVSRYENEDGCLDVKSKKKRKTVSS